MSESCAPGLDGFDPLTLTHHDKRLSEDLGLALHLQRDDLMPVPFGGNKWIKLSGILGAGEDSTVYISNGGVDSNHCRAMAAWAALNDRACHFVLHGEASDEQSPSAQILDRLGATYEIVSPDEIATSIQAKIELVSRDGKSAVVVPGGGHSREGILSFSDHAAKVLDALKPEFVIFASGTGGTQAGIIHAAHTVGLPESKVIGISVARAMERGQKVIQDALSELGLDGVKVDFRDRYRGDGYGKRTSGATDAISFASKRGLMLDPTYTGKAFHGMLDLVRTVEIPQGAKVLFWHTGGEFLTTQPARRRP